MNLYTIQLPKRRLALELNIPVLDTTVKSGDLTFAPSWEMVRAYKDGVSLTRMDLSHTEDYKINFREMMTNSWRTNRSRWLEVMSMENVALGCYCRSGQFCHRYLLIDYLKAACAKHHIPFCYMGEIE